MDKRSVDNRLPPGLLKLARQAVRQLDAASEKVLGILLPELAKDDPGLVQIADQCLRWGVRASEVLGSLSEHHPDKIRAARDNVRLGDEHFENAYQDYKVKLETLASYLEAAREFGGVTVDEIMSGTRGADSDLGLQ